MCCKRVVTTVASFLCPVNPCSPTSCLSLSETLTKLVFGAEKGGSSTSTTPPSKARMAQICQDRGRVQNSMGREGRRATLLARPTPGTFGIEGIQDYVHERVKGDSRWSNAYCDKCIDLRRLRKRTSSARQIWKENKRGASASSWTKTARGCGCGTRSAFMDDGRRFSDPTKLGIPQAPPYHQRPIPSTTARMIDWTGIDHAPDGGRNPGYGEFDDGGTRPPPGRGTGLSTTPTSCDTFTM